ncbi:hypothetical protein JVT61DRAFT_1693 [Boletus reticuloceps]|uniref:Uncharacterized protein n=1 Tax=Boletus reticuloceps TaxID=495285 RepID=A0A8I3AAW7_9AGAM|nr:hypothetical protein JVT61DRAFT_1693 [Boletus reticuloceps]
MLPSLMACLLKIQRGFDASNVTGGISGWLCKEFRELELLDDITTIQYLNLLPHQIVKWTKKDPLDNDGFHLEWKLVDRSKRSLDATEITHNHSVAQGTISLDPCLNSKKSSPSVQSLESIALLWDVIDWSCAYDLLLIFCFGIWLETPSHWNKAFKKQSIYMVEIVKGYQNIQIQHTAFVEVEKNLHTMLYQSNPNQFPMGQQFGSVNEITWYLIADEFKTGWPICPTCESQDICFLPTNQFIMISSGVLVS